MKTENELPDFSTMSDLQKCEYFIRKFDGIPDEFWQVGSTSDLHGKCCALGHCGMDSVKELFSDYNYESKALIKLFADSEKDTDMDGADWLVIRVNDARTNRIHRTPRARILAALNDIKAKCL